MEFVLSFFIHFLFSHFQLTLGIKVHKPCPGWNIFKETSHKSFKGVHS